MDSNGGGGWVSGEGWDGGSLIVAMPRITQNLSLQFDFIAC